MTIPTVVIPAYNEANVIHRSLEPLVEPSARGEVRVIVVANGCTDSTAARAAQLCPTAKVIETSTAGKTAALNLGMAEAEGVAICLDADLSVGWPDLQSLARAVSRSETDAACATMEIDTSLSSRPVVLFYQAWRRNPYHQAGKFGGVFALSPRALAELFPLPQVTADDEFVARRLAGRIAHVPSARFTVHAPRHLRDLVRIRTRSLRGTRALDQAGLAANRPTHFASFAAMVRVAAKHPTQWPALATYAWVAAVVRLNYAVTSHSPKWERDNSSRIAVTA